MDDARLRLASLEPPRLLLQWALTALLPPWVILTALLYQTVPTADVVADDPLTTWLRLAVAAIEAGALVGVALVVALPLLWLLPALRRPRAHVMDPEDLALLARELEGADVTVRVVRAKDAPSP